VRAAANPHPRVLGAAFDSTTAGRVPLVSMISRILRDERCIEACAFHPTTAGRVPLASMSSRILRDERCIEAALFPLNDP